MARVSSLSLALTTLLGLAGCSGDSPTGPSPAPVLVLPLSLETAHFLLRFTEQDAHLMDSYAAELEGNYQRILSDLGQADIGRVTGRFYPDRASFTAATGWDATGSVATRLSSRMRGPGRSSLPPALGTSVV